MEKESINFLVTGGAGHIGSTLCRELINIPNAKVTIVDNLLTGKISNIKEILDRINFIDKDVNDKAILEILNKEEFDYIFHYAAVVGVKRTQENPLMVLEDIVGIKNVLDLGRSSNSKRVFFASSSEVYGEPVEVPQNEETTPLNSRIPYAVVKNIGESFFRAYQKEYNLPFTILRFFNTYGPHQSEDFVISRFIKRAIENKPIKIYGDGRQSRTFLHVKDNIDFTLKILDEDLLINDVVNVGSEKEIPILDLANLIIKLSKSISEITFLDPLKEGDMSRRMPDISKYKQIYDKELLSLESGISELINTRLDE